MLHVTRMIRGIVLSFSSGFSFNLSLSLPLCGRCVVVMVVVVVVCCGVWICFLLLSLLSLFPSPLTHPRVDPNTPPSVDSRRLRVYRQQVHMFYTCGRDARTHGDVPNRHTKACWDLHTFVFPRFFQRAAPNTPHSAHHQTHTTNNTTTATTTTPQQPQHNTTPPHNITR